MYSETTPPVPESRSARKRASRTALLQAAMGLISRGGIGVVTHRSVAAEAGVSPALVTYHFSDIDGLLAATREHAITVGAGKLAAAIERVRAGDVTIIEATAAYLSNVILDRTEEFMVALEFDLAAARHGGTTANQHHARDAYLTLIRPFVASDESARRVFSAIFGYAFHGTLGMHSGELADCAAFLIDLFDRYDVNVVPPYPEEPTA